MNIDKDLPFIYVGCALTGAPREFVDSVEAAKDSLRASGRWQVMDFVGLEDGDSGDVYRQDIDNCVKRCDVFVAVADYPATGLGWELGVADEREIPTLVVAKVGSEVTRLVLGASEVRDHITFARYKSLDQLVDLTEEHLLPKLSKMNTAVSIRD